MQYNYYYYSTGSDYYSWLLEQLENSLSLNDIESEHEVEELHSFDVLVGI